VWSVLPLLSGERVRNHLIFWTETISPRGGGLRRERAQEGTAEQLTDESRYLAFLNPLEMSASSRCSPGAKGSGKGPGRALHPSHSHPFPSLTPIPHIAE